jgi:acrylyl-CoA reductase (NADPH)
MVAIGGLGAGLEPGSSLRSARTFNGFRMDRFNAYRTFQEDNRVVSRFVEMSLDELDPGEVVIRTEYSSINYKDALSHNGTGKIIRRFPCNAGIDAAGEVVSSADPRFRAGDKVIVTSWDFGVAHDGGYSEMVRAPAKWVVPMPPGMTTFEAMVLGTAGFTAGLARERMEQNGLSPDKGPVVVTGATGGVGSVAIEILAKGGYHVVALTGKPEEEAYLKHLGAAEILDRRTVDWGKRPLEKATWAGAVDNIGGDALAWMTRTIKQGGTIASCGLAASIDLHTTVMPFILRGASLLGIDSGYWPMPQREKLWQRLAGEWKPEKVGAAVKTIPLAELPQVFGRLLEGRMTGRYVVQIGRLA